MHPLILRARALFNRTDCTRRSKFLTHSLIRDQNLACYVSFDMSYSLVLWITIWKIVIPMRLELLKTHHCSCMASSQGNFVAAHADLESKNWLKNLIEDMSFISFPIFFFFTNFNHYQFQDMQGNIGIGLLLRNFREQCLPV